MHALYAGELWEGGTCLERARVLENAGWHLTTVDVTRHLYPQNPLVRKLQLRRLKSPYLDRLNQIVLDVCLNNPKIQIVWIDKGRWLYPETLERIRQERHPLMIHYTPDPAFTVHTSRHFVRSLPEYDLCITTKSYEIDEYRKRGARNTLHTLQGIDNRFVDCRGCAEISQRNHHDIVFIGHYEPHYKSILSTASKAGLPLQIWGPRWHRSVGSRPLRKHLRREQVWGNAYVNTLSKAKVGLGLLSKLCPDAFTTRSFEIPAAGAMLLGERTDEHLALFDEGTEAEYFSSKEELIDKATFYLENDQRRATIATAGRAKTLSRYHWQHVLQPALSEINLLLNL